MTMKQLLGTLVLPREVTAFEREYLARINRIALVFFALHIPLLSGIAWANETGPVKALLLTVLAVSGPALAMRALSNPRWVSMVFGVVAMFMGALLVHFGRGLWTIEMHFYFFVALALLAVFANPMVVVVAAVTVAAHHFVLWFIAPTSVFNYDAPLSSVLVHALFVVLESVAAIFVARSFFDNVIGLERIVATRTAQLDQKNAEMTLVFENVQQGFLTASVDGVLHAQHSKVVTSWLTTPAADERVWDFFGRVDPAFGAWLRLGWESLVEDVMPREVSVSQLPRALSNGGRSFEVSYQLVEVDGAISQVLVLVSDVTERVASEVADVARREAMQVFERVVKDRSAFLEFFADAGRQVAQLEATPCALSEAAQRRVIHTVKGNCAMFGMFSVTEACNAVEAGLAERGDSLTPDDRAKVALAWRTSSTRLQHLFQDQTVAAIELDEADVVGVMQAIKEGVPQTELLRLVESWKHETVSRRFERCADEAHSLSTRLGKGALTVEIEGRQVRLPREHFAPVWGVVGHLVRNAIDHGFATRPEKPTLRLAASLRDDEVVISVGDNGGGIDWGRLADSARQRGLPTESREDLERALFADGITTRTDATDISGRGVGLAAVKEVCERLGGHLRVTSTNTGTTFALVFPDTAARRSSSVIAKAA